jgi:protocatechuate 3,4-dioxygenase beta subunit
MTLAYPISSLKAHPAWLSPDYRSTVERSPSKPLIITMRHTLSELTGPVYGQKRCARAITISPPSTVTSRSANAFAHGHVLDEDGRGVPNALVELWQANACGRYIHAVDQHPAPLDPNFTRAGRTQADSQG